MKKNLENKGAVVFYEDCDVKQNFDRFCDKIQALLAQYHRSRHVVFTPANLRMLYILYLCKIHECSVYKNHHCHLCIIYDRDSIVAMDINTRYPPNEVVKGFMKHAEINAILAMRKTNPNSTACQQYGMFITRFSKTSVLNHSHPCFFCARFIKKNIDYFHSITFTGSKEELIVMTPHDFLQTEFSHKSQRYKNIIFVKEKQEKLI